MKGGSSLISQLDMFTPGWLGQSDTAPDGITQSICSEGNPGGALAALVPTVVSYVIAFAARRHACLSDCNATNAVGQNGCTSSNSSDLCTKGAQFIRDNFTSLILPIYQSYAKALAGCYGTTRPMIWEMEPDYYQYSSGQGGNPLSATEAASYMDQIMTAVRAVMPNAVFSLDISPWMPSNGSGWYPGFALGNVSFLSTSGGDTSAATSQIRTSNGMTWSGVHMVTGKPILADTGYGANGASSGYDSAWDTPANINARIADGVVGITQYNPDPSTWGSIIAAERAQLNPVTCY